jgi:N-methylhydantoinase A/oxoprolinase/acetone carboxylase beta subunit
MRLGINVGDTNTHAVLMKDTAILGDVQTTTPPDLAAGLTTMLQTLMTKTNINPSQIKAITIGTSHFTRAIIERHYLTRVAVIRLGLPATQAILPFTDLFLYDLKLVDEARHKQYTGVTIRLLLGNLRRLVEAGAHLLVRIPLIPGVNDDAASIHQFAELLASMPGLEGVAVMPYHKIGVAKYQTLGMDYRLGDVQPPAEDQISQVEELFLTTKLPVIRHARRAV